MGLAGLSFAIYYPVSATIKRTFWKYKVYTDKVTVENNAYTPDSWPVNFSVAVFQGTT